MGGNAGQGQGGGRPQSTAGVPRGASPPTTNPQAENPHGICGRRDEGCGAGLGVRRGRGNTPTQKAESELRKFEPGYAQNPLLVTGRLSFHVRFYITDVKQTLLGVQDMLQGNVQLNLRDTYTSTIQKGDVEEPLLFHDKHFYVEALVLPQDHKLNYLWLHYLQSKLFRATMTVYYTTGDGEVHEQAGEAQRPRSSKPPQLPTEEERLLHELTHQPYRSWCEVCQRSKGRPAYHK